MLIMLSVIPTRSGEISEMLTTCQNALSVVLALHGLRQFYI